MKKPLFVIAVLACLAPSAAFAQYVDRDDSARFEEEFDRDDFMVTAYGRMVAIPGFMLNLFLAEHENHWSKGQKNFAWGGDISWRRGGEYEIGLAVDWADLSMPDGWWLDRDEPVDEADWTTVDMQLLSITFFSRWFWDVQPWFSPYVGVGIGPGIIFGGVNKHNPRPGSDCRADLEGGTFAPESCNDANGDIDIDNDFEDPVPEEAIPPIVPVLGVNGGVRFNIAEYGVLRLELGFQDYIYAGAHLGVQW